MQEYDFIGTAEQVHLERPLAGPGSRLVASIVDHIILALVYIATLFALFLAGVSVPASPYFFEKAGPWVLAVIILLFFSSYWAYFIGCEFILNGQTAGKRYISIRVAGEEGLPVSFMSVIIRNFLRLADGIGFYALGGAVMFFSSRAQRLGDMAAGTVVVSEEIPEYSARTDKNSGLEVPEEAEAQGLHAAGLEPEQYRALRQYWMRRSELTLDARLTLLPKLLRPALKDDAELPEEDLHKMEDRLEELLREAGDVPEPEEGEE